MQMILKWSIKDYITSITKQNEYNFCLTFYLMLHTDFLIRCENGVIFTF